MAAFLAGDDPAASPAAITVGAFGDLATLYLICCSAGVFRDIWRNRTVGDVKPPYTYLAALCNCCVWVLFSFAHDNTWSVLVINGFGVVAELGYVVVYLKFADQEDELQFQWPLLTLVVVLLGVGTLAAFGYGLRIAADLFSYAGLVSGVLLYCVPLYYTAQDAEEMNAKISVAMFINAVFWVAYAVIIKSFFVFLPNMVGVVSAVLQLAVLISFKE